MAKGTSFVCQSCGFESPKWLGKCPNCQSWASFVEFREAKVKGSSKKEARKAQYLKDVGRRELIRISTKEPEVDRVLGGGMVPGQVILLAGEPGIGKSTLLLQIASGVGSVFYVLGEESISQVNTRVTRLGIEAAKIAFLEETDVDVVLATLELEYKKSGFKVVIIDSVQTMYSDGLTGSPGTISQVKGATLQLIRFAKANNVPVVLVGHVTKDGTVAGPATLAHMVDTVLWFEGDKVSPLRILRSVKNRFADTSEVGIFQMSGKGMESADKADTLFLEKERVRVPGAVVSCVMEGTRPILVEVQALVAPTKLAFPRRVVHGLYPKRVELMIAVLTRHCGLRLSEQDVFVNVVGGIKVKDPGVDLAVAMAIATSLKNISVKTDTLVVGEVGLLGEIRKSQFEEKRREQGRRQGFKNIVDSSGYKLVSEVLKTLK
ncbi:DNA repair protein RadA [Candidatus Woesebacteria bacterium RIFCSPHIGHO2_01_FULL_44_21]|uniref:DNA repair protein RadA n=1 Tax=Candidatus Woesebacteria bacterium RIFCSPHIGHO2_01_FULL_44_21 TaxID=1802503 RepID=A0A1F7YYT8_9BACT|nr:MAG: DNA repair protein RadA [Candidatus Woesebacteria bacterium RIFCSPHIGHO2_01_FULL_44_21]OGM69094.1 MAG: DNA repair protein RadA [Candidatus Woesebacteria bacterium RIFCSPLOWO2_01_FULL_44_24b]